MTQHILALNSYLQSPIEGLLEIVRTIKLAHERRKAIHSTIKELNKLSDRELNDIGIARGDIYSVAAGDPTLKRSANENENLKGWV
jgi:uncharacterized protein YjiS (DUF1127 family)